jgi:hypothetical protein
VGVVIEIPEGLHIIIIPVVVYPVTVLSRDNQWRTVGAGGTFRCRVTAILAYFRRRPVVSFSGDGID